MRNHIVHIDRTILRLLDERARAAQDIDDPGHGAPALGDLLKRADGDFDARELAVIFEAIERGSVASRPPGGVR